MSRLDTLTDDELIAAIKALHMARMQRSFISMWRFVTEAIQILEGTDEQEPTDGDETDTPQAAETQTPRTA